jgi:hypothetical protein
VLRLCALIWLATPILINPPWRFWADARWFPLFWGCAVANGLIFWRGAKLAARIPRPRLAMECIILAVGVALVTAYQAHAFPSFLRRGAADEIFVSAPVLGTGSPELEMFLPDALQDTVRTGRIGLWHVIIIFAGAIAVWSAVALLRLGIAMRRVARTTLRERRL